MGPNLIKRNVWKTDLFTVEEIIDESGNRKYFIDSIQMDSRSSDDRETSIIFLKKHIDTISNKINSISYKEIIKNLDAGENA